MKNAAVAMMVVAAAAAASEAAAAPTRVATVLPVYKPCSAAGAACGAADEAKKWVQPEMRAECDASPCGPKPGATWVDHSHFTGVKGSAIPWAQPARQVDHVPEAEAGRVVVTHEGEWQAVPAGAAALAEFMASASPVKVLEGGHNAHGPLAHGQTVRWVSPEELRGDQPKKRMVPVQQLHPDEFTAADERNRIQGVPADEAKEVRSDIVRPSFLEEPQKVATTTVLHPFTTVDQGRSTAYVPLPGARTVKVPATVVDADQVPQEGRVSGGGTEPHEPAAAVAAAAEHGDVLEQADRAETMLKELEAHSTDEASAPVVAEPEAATEEARELLEELRGDGGDEGDDKKAAEASSVAPPTLEAHDATAAPAPAADPAAALDAASPESGAAADDDAGQLDSARAELRHAVEKAKESEAVDVAARGKEEAAVEHLQHAKEAAVEAETRAEEQRGALNDAIAGAAAAEGQLVAEEVRGAQQEKEEEQALGAGARAGRDAAAETEAAIELSRAAAAGADHASADATAAAAAAAAEKAALHKAADQAEGEETKEREHEARVESEAHTVKAEAEEELVRERAVADANLAAAEVTAARDVPLAEAITDAASRIENLEARVRAAQRARVEAVEQPAAGKHSLHAARLEARVADLESHAAFEAKVEDEVKQQEEAPASFFERFAARHALNPM